MLGKITIRYICDKNHLTIICIISYFDIYHFFDHYFHYNIYAIILISLQRTAGTPRFLFFDTYNKFVVLTTDKPRLFTVVFNYIAYFTNNTGKCCVFVIYRHKGKCNSWIFIQLLFCLSHQKTIQDKIK